MYQTIYCSVLVCVCFMWCYNRLWRRDVFIGYRGWRGWWRDGWATVCHFFKYVCSCAVCAVSVRPREATVISISVLWFWVCVAEPETEQYDESTLADDCSRSTSTAETTN